MAADAKAGEVADATSPAAVRWTLGAGRYMASFIE